VDGRNVLNNESLLRPIEATDLSESVYQILRQWIINQSFNPGQRLNLTELEDSLQVSRTPLKTALKRLELEGFVEIQARSGTFIAQIDREKLDENYKIRSSFELYVALCLFKYLTEHDYQVFKQIQDDMNQLVNSCHDNWQLIVTDYLELDRQFHERLVARGGPQRMLDLFKQMNVHTHMVRIVRQYHPREFQSMHFEHEQIFSSIFSQSPERLSATLLNHLESARYRALKHFEE
jgi:DNA-binding GntR family transcriptional regulator